MNDLPRRILIDIIAQYGPGLVDEPRRVEGLLKDLCGEHKREINTLMDASREGVARDLRSAAGSSLPPEVFMANLIHRLLDNRGLSEEMARWAVETWAAALGIGVQPGPSYVPAAPSTPAVQYVQPVSPPARTAPPIIPLIQPVSSPVQRSGLEPDLVRVPAGEFWMGSTDQDKNARNEEKPYHKVYLDEYWMGRHPVTVAEFARFVQRAGYTTTAEKRKSDHAWQKPRGKGSSIAGMENHPAVNVSWEDADEYCRWLSRETGWRYTLPSEAQWEKAARGTSGKIYPWGSLPLDKDYCNIAGWFGGTTPVGQFSPSGDSPYGCADMLGNVWEWVADWYGEKYYQVSPPRNPPGIVSGQYRTLRGGSWVSYHGFARCAFRDGDVPGLFSSYGGFRLLSPGAT